MKNENVNFRIYLALIALFTVCLSCWHIYNPGLYYDEVLFGNAAVGGKTDNFVRMRLLGVPFLLMDYIGALKAWIYYPIFAIFPVNSWTVRLPSILFGTAGSLGLVLGLWRGFGKSAAMAGAVMIILDPTIVIHSRLDWGPNALMFFFRGLMFLSMVEWIKTGRPKWAWWAVVAGALGIFDKLNFIWIAFAGLGSIVLIYSNAIINFTRSKPRQTLILAGIVITGFTAAIIRAILVAEHIDINWPDRFTYAFMLLRYTFSGGGALNVIAGDGFRLERWFLPGYLIAIVIGVIGWKSLSKNLTDRRLYIWMWTFMLLICISFLLTKSATGPHHSSVMSGIWQLTLAPLLGAAWNNHEQRLRQLRLLAVPATLVLIFAGSTVAIILCINAFKYPSNANWDRANENAALFAKKYPDSQFISSDWGIGTQVIALTKDHPGIEDAWPLFTKQEDAENYLKNLSTSKDIYIYTRLPEFENIKGTRANLISALEKNNMKHDIVMTYNDWKGKPMIEIWKITPALK